MRSEIAPFAAKYATSGATLTSTPRPTASVGRQRSLHFAVRESSAMTPSEAQIIAGGAKRKSQLPSDQPRGARSV
jgi:hypothetical protein